MLEEKRECVRAVRVLLADDSEDDELIVRELLSDCEGLDLQASVRNGSEALAYLRNEGEYVREERPELLLLDINMPGKNGFEVLAEMKADKKLSAIPVVMLTTSRLDDDVVKSYEKGACGYLVKPDDFVSYSSLIGKFSTYWSGVVKVPHATSATGPTTA